VGLLLLWGLLLLLTKGCLYLRVGDALLNNFLFYKGTYTHAGSLQGRARYFFLLTLLGFRVLKKGSAHL
jgi:hypothetical protein